MTNGWPFLNNYGHHIILSKRNDHVNNISMLDDQKGVFANKATSSLIMQDTRINLAYSSYSVSLTI